MKPVKMELLHPDYMENTIKDILLAASLCADCFAVSLCSSISIKNIRWNNLLGIALVFAIVQTLFLFVGWCFGDFIARYFMNFVSWIGMGLLVFVGASMIRDAFSEEESQNFNGLRNILIASMADSIDALAVGISMSMAGRTISGLSVPLVSVFLITGLSVIAGIKGGTVIGCKAGRSASVIGGIVLILLGLNIVADVF